MIQAFVSLKLHYPSRTESGIRSFFEALQNAVFSQPTVFRTNIDESVRPYSLDSICEAALNPGCKFVVLRAECERFWQCTFLLPDKQGMGALFFDLQRLQNPRRLSPDSLIEMFKKLYRSMSPRLIRIGDSEAREKLKSRHGLVMMPGLGRIEWLQIVAPEVYGDIYNPSELVAAPGYATEIWEDGALFMRVYDDPNDWDSEDNISQANFIPGFLAGVAKIKDSEKEKETIRGFERLWSRAEKTAEKAYEVLSADPNNVPKVEAQKVEAKPVEVVEEVISAPAMEMDSDDVQKREIVYNRLRSEFTVEKENIVKVGVEGPCTVFKVKAERKPMFYATYQDRDLKVFILNAGEDLSRFLSENGCSVQADNLSRLKELIGKYYHPEYTLLETLDDLPSTVIRDRRMPEIRERFKSAEVRVENGNQVLTLWFYKPEYQGLESLHLVQFEDWPMQIESKVEATDMENEPEPVAAPVVETKVVEPSEPVVSAAAESEVVSAEGTTETTDVVPAADQSERDNVPAKKGSAVKLVVVILAVLILAYIAIAFAVGGGDFNPANWNLSK